MEITITAGELGNLLRAVRLAVPPRSYTLPALTHALLRADAGRIAVSATNLELAIIAGSGAEMRQSGGICVPHRLLLDLVNTLAARDRLTMRSEPGDDDGDDVEFLLIEQNRRRARIKGSSARQFPPLPRPVAAATPLTYESGALATAIDKVIHAASRDEKRPILTGLLLEQARNQLNLVAADGFRLAIAKLETANDQQIKSVIPARSMQAVANAFRRQQGSVQLQLSPRKDIVHFTTPNLCISSQIMGGNYPNYTELIPDRYDNRVIVHRDALRRAVSICAILAQSGSNIVRMETSDNGLRLSSRSEWLGSGEVEIDALECIGHTRIALNARYLLDIANAPGTDRIAIATTDPKSPAVFEDEDGLKTEVVMPMYVQW